VKSKNLWVWVFETESKSKNCQFCVFQKPSENPPLGFIKELALPYPRSGCETET
jgi:hypothetical protein